MAFWIFKVSDQRLYADIEGVRYEYDNRHSVRVRPGDGFVYLDKRAGGYRFTGAGAVLRVNERPPTETERRRGKVVRTVYTAVLTDVTLIEPPLDISAGSAAGRRNRESLGIPVDVNAKGWGWSISMPSIPAEQFRTIVAAGLTPRHGWKIAPKPATPSWAPPEGVLLLPVRSGGLLSAASGGALQRVGGPSEAIELPRRAHDPASVGLRAEQIVHDFLAGGELQKFGGARLRWTSRDGEQPGWDLEYWDAEACLNGVEVKGTTAVRFTSVEVTENEWKAAAELRHRYWLYLVADCLGSWPQIQRIQDPFGRVEKGELRVMPAVWRLLPTEQEMRTSHGLPDGPTEVH